MNFIKTPQELKQILDKDNSSLVLIDVRTPEEFNSRHIKGAINLDINHETFTTKIKNLDPNKKYIVYCRSGGRSLAAYQKMMANNLNVANCLFGMLNVNGDVLEVE